MAGLAEDIGKPITARFMPPGTSKWGWIEHCLFSDISTNWAGEPLISDEAAVNLIAETTTPHRPGCPCETRHCDWYPLVIKILDSEMKALMT